MASDNRRGNDKPRNPIVDGFLDYLKVEKGLAALSVSSYRSDLIQFAEFLETRRRTLAQARREDVRGFLSQLFSNSVKDRSVARKLSTLRHFYKYLLLDRVIKHDPTLEIDSPRQWKVLPKSLARTEVEDMIKSAGNSAARPHRDGKLAAALAQRDCALMEMLYAGGLRVTEIVNVKLEDLKLEMGHVLVRGKGDKERIIPMGRAAQDEIRAYLGEGRETLLNGKVSAQVG